MLEFSKERFAELLLAAPSKEPYVAAPEHSAYVQTLMDQMKELGELDLAFIDWDAFNLHHVTPRDYEKLYLRTSEGWANGIIHFCKKTPAVLLQTRTFF